MSAPHKGMHGGKDRKTKGRTAITGPAQTSSTPPGIEQTLLTETNRPVTASGNGNKHRGDRRDMSKTYTNNAKHSARGNNPRTDVSTRAL